MSKILGLFIYLGQINAPHRVDDSIWQALHAMDKSGKSEACTTVPIVKRQIGFFASSQQGSCMFVLCGEAFFSDLGGHRSVRQCATDDIRSRPSLIDHARRRLQLGKGRYDSSQAVGASGAARTDTAAQNAATASSIGPELSITRSAVLAMSPPTVRLSR